MTPHETRRPVPTTRTTLARALTALAAPMLVGTASATVSTTLVADTYNVVDGAKIYSVLDVYVTGSALGDAMSSVLGLSGTTAWPVIFATSLATGTGLTRDADGKITAGSVTRDVFVQAGSSSWLPTYTGAGAAWDSFVTLGARKQGASVTNRAGVKKAYDATTIQAGAGFGQLAIGNSNFIENGGTGGWYSSLGANCYSSAGASELPFVRCSLYNATWNSIYTDLDRTGRLVTIGRKQTGRASATTSAVFAGEVGSTLDFCFMVGRFTIDVTGISEFTPPTMQVQFNMIGKHGTGNETGTTFTGSSNAAFRISQFFTFAVPSRIPLSPTGVIATDGTDASRVQITWPAVAGATSYQVWRAPSGGVAAQIGTTATNSYDDTTALPATLYSYQLKSVNDVGVSALSTAETGWRALPTATGIAAGDGASSASVTVNWNAVVGATGYRVLRGPAGGTLASIGTIAEPPYVDATAVPGKLYTYGVSATCALGDSPSGTDNGYRLILPPVGLGATDGTETAGVVLNWTASTGATGYKVFRGIGTADTLVATVGATTTYTDATTVPGVTYTYGVRAVGDGAPDSALSATDTGFRSLPAPQSVVASLGTNLDGIVVNWAPVPGITDFKVYRSQGEAAPALLASVGTNSHTDLTALPGQLYTYRVRATQSGVDGPVSGPATGWRGIAAPVGVNATDGGSTSEVVVTWTASAGAASYRIFRGVGAPSTQIGTVTAPATSFTDTTAAPGVLFTYAVRPAGPVGTGDGVLSATNTGYRALSPPTGLSASDGGSLTGIALAWTAAEGATGYRIMRSTGDGAPVQVALPAGTSFNDNGVAAGVVYRYTVMARGPVGVADSVASAPDTGWRAVAAPSALTASDGTSTAAVNLAWTGSAGAVHRIFRSSGGGTPEFIGSTALTSYADSTAVPGRVFSYTVRSETPGGETESSVANTGWRRLLPPAALSASDGASTSGVQLSWTLPDGAITAIKLFRANGANPAVAIATLGGDATNYTDTTAVPGTSYAYTAKATGETGTGDSEASAANTGWRGLLAPLNLRASDGTSAAAVNLTWTGSIGAASYRVLRSTGGGAAAEIAVVAAPAASYADATAEPAVIYTYSVQARGAEGTGSSEPSLGDTGWRASPAPTGVLASDGTSTSGVTISWNQVVGASAYKVYRATTSTTPVLIGSTAGTSHIDVAALPGILYTYTVKATTSSGDTPPSTPDTGWRNMVAPTGVAATDGTRLTDVLVTWVGTPGAVTYKVMRATGDAAPALVATVGASIFNFTDVTAVPGTAYRYSVKAAGAMGTGDSAASAVDTGWRMLSAPTSLLASDGTSPSQVTLTWNAAAGAVSYKVFRSGTADPVGTTLSPSYADTTAAIGVTYVYTVKAVGGIGESAATAGDAGWRGLAAPTGVVASDGSSTASVSVTWSAVTGATGYRLLRAAPGAAASVVAVTSSPSYVDTAAIPGVLYTYSAQATCASGAGPISSTNTGWRNLVAPATLAATDGTSSTAVIVSWAASSGASGYKVLRASAGGVPAAIATVRAGVLSFSDTSAAPGVVYTYSARAMGMAGTGDSASSPTDTGYRSGSGGPSGLTVAGGDSGDGPVSTPGSDDGLLAAPMGVERYLLATADVPENGVDCAAADAATIATEVGPTGSGADGAATTASDDAADAQADQASVPEEGAHGSFIDLDANGEPDLCQLRRGDLDLSGSVDENDLSVLLMMFGQEPPLGIGDLDGDGLIDDRDLRALAAMLPVKASADN